MGADDEESRDSGESPGDGATAPSPAATDSADTTDGTGEIGGPETPEVANVNDLDAARSRVRRHNPVLLAWVFTVGVAGVATLLFDYETLHTGARVLFYASLVELAWALPEEQAHDRNSEQFVFIGVSLIAICLGLVFEGAFAFVSLDLGAAQLFALAGLVSRVYVNYLYDDTLRGALTDTDPVTHPFITVAGLTTFGLGLTARFLSVATGGAIPAPDSALAFFPVVVVGATAGLVAYAFDVRVVTWAKRELRLAAGDVPER